MVRSGSGPRSQGPVPHWHIGKVLIKPLLERDKEEEKEEKEEAEAQKRNRQGTPSFASGSKVDYGKALEVSSGSSDNESVFRDDPSSGNGTSLQLQLQEYALKLPGQTEGGGGRS